MHAGLHRNPSGLNVSGILKHSDPNQDAHEGPAAADNLDFGVLSIHVSIAQRHIHSMIKHTFNDQALNTTCT